MIGLLLFTKRRISFFCLKTKQCVCILFEILTRVYPATEEEWSINKNERQCLQTSLKRTCPVHNVSGYRPYKNDVILSSQSMYSLCSLSWIRWSKYSNFRSDSTFLQVRIQSLLHSIIQLIKYWPCVHALLRLILILWLQ